MATTSPKNSGTILITKPLDRADPITIVFRGTWTHVEISSLERKLVKQLRLHQVQERKRNLTPNTQEPKGQD